jgi:dUTP pyrophosphatase
MKRVNIKVKRTAGGNNLPLPQYMTKGAAGLDLYAAVKHPEVINPGCIKLIPTGLCIEVPEGYEAQVRPRSGLALKYGITMVNSPGTIDADYRGEIGLIMINHGQSPFEIKRGDRVAQMVISPIAQADFVEVENLDDTVRSIGGYGSTGRQ